MHLLEPQQASGFKPATREQLGRWAVVRDRVDAGMRRLQTVHAGLSAEFGKLEKLPLLIGLIAARTYWIDRKPLLGARGRRRRGHARAERRHDPLGEGMIR